MNLYKLGGMTNTNYLLETTEGKFVIKVLSDFGCNGVKFIDRKSDIHNTKEVCEKTNISYEICKTIGNIRVCNFFDGYRLIDQTKCSEVVEFAKTINKLHNSKCEFYNKVNCKNLLDVYTCNISNKYNKSIVIELKSVLCSELDNIYRTYIDIIESLGRFDRDEPCLFDTVPENVMINDEGKCKLIDWEYSGKSDRMWDLGNFATESDLSEELRYELLKEYESYSTLSLDDKLAFMCYTFLSNYLWAVWTIAKISQTEDSEETSDLVEYFRLRVSKANKEYNTYERDIKLMCKELNI